VRGAAADFAPLGGGKRQINVIRLIGRSVISRVQGGVMMEDKAIQVTCPKCGIKITNTANWFKKPGTCCPGCQLRFGTERFKRSIEEAEKKL
jgi:hypothetical protein